MFFRDDQWDELLYHTAKRFIHDLFMLLKTASIHDINNTAFVQALSTVSESLTELSTRLGNVTLEAIDSTLFINEQKIRSDIYSHASFKFLESALIQRELGGLNFTGNPDTRNIAGFVVVFSSFKSTGQNPAAHLNNLLSEKGIADIEVSPQKEKTLTAKEETTVFTNKAKALRQYVRAVETVKDAVTSVTEKRGINLGRAKKIVFNLVQHSADEGYSFVSLSTIKNYDEYTFHHCVNVCVIAIAFGQNLGLSKRQLADLGMGALFHDFGKLYIPTEILNKTGQFSASEWHLMKQHPVLAVKHLLPLKGATDADVKKLVPALEHHREYNLSGYPPMIIRKPLSFYSKVVAIADAYDALTTERVYQKGRLPHEALQLLLKGAGKRFDPVLVKAFINTMGVYPVGTLVQLSNDFMGIVCEPPKSNDAASRPIVSVMMDISGNLRKESVIDLSSQNYSDVTIVKARDPNEFNINVSHYLLASDKEIT